MVTIRPLRSAELRDAYGVVRDCQAAIHGPSELSLGMFANLVSVGSASVADSSDGICGVGVRVGEDSGIWVRPLQRRRGVGTELLRAIERDARRGVLRVIAVTAEPA